MVGLLTVTTLTTFFYSIGVTSGVFVLEISSDVYTVRFGQGVTQSDVLHVIPGNPKATIVADLTRGDGLPECRFDCVILTQTLQYIYDVSAAIRTVHRILRPGGVVLCTVPGITQISVYDNSRWGEYWRFTSLSINRLFQACFPPDSVQVRAHGNVLAAIAFLQGLVVEDVTAGELDFHDPEYELIITIRAVRSA
jgi:SAM-dependent methyltransferase